MAQSDSGVIYFICQINFDAPPEISYYPDCFLRQIIETGPVMKNVSKILIFRFALILKTALTAGSAALADKPVSVPRFQDVTAGSGLVHTYGGHTDYVVGGGAAAFDCNNDGLSDLAVAGGAHPAALFVNRSDAGGAIRFEKVSGFDRKAVTGLYPLDIDGDGLLDLFVLRFGRNLLMKGEGKCRFSERTDEFGLPEEKDWTTAFAATWESGRERPTLAVGNYVPRDRPLQKSGNCDPSYLLRAKQGTYQAPILLGPGACTLSALFVDWSGEGETDLRFANDREYYDQALSDQLWRLTKSGAVAYTRSDGWSEPKLWGMGIAARDINGDGRPDMMVTSMADNRLETLRPSPEQSPDFQDSAYSLGATAHRPYAGGDKRPSTAWHPEFADFNNDGLPDLLIMKGNVDAMPKMANFDPDNLLLGTRSGFREAGAEAGIAVDTRGRGAAVADFNLDGALDLITINRDQPVRVFKQSRPVGNFVNRSQVRKRKPVCRRRESDRSRGRETTTITRRVGGGHGGGSLLPLHFGIGSSGTAEARVTWPDGSGTDWREIAAGSRLVIEKEQP